MRLHGANSQSEHRVDGRRAREQND